jgi:hypothetical protein
VAWKNRNRRAIISLNPEAGLEFQDILRLQAAMRGGDSTFHSPFVKTVLEGNSVRGDRSKLGFPFDPAPLVFQMNSIGEDNASEIDEPAR